MTGVRTPEGMELERLIKSPGTINWMVELGDPELATMREGWNVAKSRWEREILYGADWFVIHANPCLFKEDEFIGVFDVRAVVAGLPLLISDRAFRLVPTGGAGPWATSLDALRAGIRLTTGGTGGDDVTMVEGDNNAIVRSWNVSQDIYFHAHFRFPNPADLTNIFLLAGKWRDNDNYICIRFDPTGTYYAANPNLLLVTRSAGVETVTSLGAPDNNWHVCWARSRATSVRFVIDGGATIVHTTNIPAGNMAEYCFLETEENAAKNFDFQHLLILQDT